MRALITGAAGFVGRHLIAHLLSSGDDVLALVHRLPRQPLSVKTLPWDISQPVCDQHDLHTVVFSFAPEVIYHLAGISLPKLCGEHEPSPAAIAVNVTGTRHVLQLAQGLDSPPRVLLASSSYVYAPVSKQHFVVDETYPTEPRRSYGQTKLLAEQHGLAAVAEHQADVVIARAFNHTGPGQEPQYMLPEWAKQVAEGCNPLQVQNRQANLHLTDVRDVVRAYRLLMQHGTSGGVYNFGSGINRCSGEVLEHLLQLAQVEPKIAEPETAGWKQGPVADITRLRQATHWEPEISLEQTIFDTLADWRSRTNSKWAGVG